MSLTFDGLNYITKASAIVAAAPMTFACWFNPTSHTADAYIMGITSATSTHSSVFAMKFLTASTKVCCYISNDAASTTDITAASTNLVATNATWFHLACVFTSATSRTSYVNGGGAVTSAVSVTPGTCDSSFTGDVKFNALVKTGAIGQIAFPAFWNVALTSTDILALSSSIGPLRGHPAGLVGYPRLTGGNSPEPDMVSSTGWTLVSG